MDNYTRSKNRDTIVGKRKDSTMGEKYSKDGVFSERDVVRIREGIRSGTPTEVFAQEFNVTAQCIRDLAFGRTHADLNTIAPPVKEPSRLHHKTQSQKKLIFEKREQGLSQADIAREMKLSEGYISLVLSGKR